MSDKALVKCFTSEDAEKLKQNGFTFFKEEDGEYIFFNDSTINFSDEEMKIAFFSDINC